MTGQHPQAAPTSAASLSHPIVPPIAIPRPSSPAMDVDIMGLSPSRQSPIDAPQSPVLAAPHPSAPSAPATASSVPKSKIKEDTTHHHHAKESKASATKSEKVKSEKSRAAPASAAPASPPSASSSSKPSRLFLRGHSAEVVATVWNPKNAELLATCSSDSTVRLWTLQQGIARASSAALHHGAKVKPGMTPPSQVLNVQWNASGACLATACFDGSVRLWDAGVGIPKTQLNTKLSAHNGAVFALRWNPTGSLLATGGADRALCLWSHSPSVGGVAVPSTLVHKFPDHHQDSIVDIDFAYYQHHLRPTAQQNPSSSSWLIATASTDKTVNVVQWPALSSTSSSSSSSTDPNVPSSPSSTVFVCKGHTQPVNSVRWSTIPSSATEESSPSSSIPLLASASDDGSVRLWSGFATTASESSEAEPPAISSDPLLGHSKEVYVVRWSPKSPSFLASASFDTTVKLWDSVQKTCVKTLAGHSEAVLSLDYSPSGNLLATGSQDKSVCIWDTNGNLVKQYQCTGCVLDVAMNPAEDRVAACCTDNSAVIFDLRM